VSRIAFVLANPRHHVEMMAPVARLLAAQGHAVRVVSMAELRGFATPAIPGLDVVRAMPTQLRQNPSVGSAHGAIGADSPLRRAARSAVWHGALRPLHHWYLGDADVVVVPNDGVYPYRQLARWLRRRGTPFVLMQEGIRFPLPCEQGDETYGLGGAAAICAWGEASAAHFRRIGVPAARVHTTGTPRYDQVAPAEWTERGLALRARLGLDQAPLLYLSNPIDDQEFCTRAEKLELFRRFALGAAPALAAEGRAIVVKLHPREDVAAYRAVAASVAGAVPAIVVDDAGLFEVLAMGAAAVVLASTVGLEALTFGVPIGVLAIPGHGHVFDYVSGGGAVGLDADRDLAASVGALLALRDRPLTPEVARYLEQHMAHRGEAATRVAACITGVLAEHTRGARGQGPDKTYRSLVR
jgi:hypothetical protein